MINSDSLDLADTRPTPECQYAAAELSMTLKERISILPFSFQSVLEMRYLRELSNEAAAVTLDMVLLRSRRGRLALASSRTLRTTVCRCQKCMNELVELHLA
jgi:DNA-directed RNA polymerase specialized sigma24 family protein